MIKSRYEAILNIRQKYLIWSYLADNFSTCNIQDYFCFTQVPLFSQNSNLSVTILTDLIKCDGLIRQTNRSYMPTFSVGLDLLFSNVLKEIFELGTSSSPSFKRIVQRSRDNSKICTVIQSNLHEKSLAMLYILNNLQNRHTNGW